MKLAVLGLAAVVVGVALGLPGLIGIGGYWVLLGPVVRLHGLRMKAMQGESKKPVLDTTTFVQGTALWAAIGIPSLVVGVLEIGIDAEHAGWRWVPLGMGIFALGIGGLSAALYLAGGAAMKIAEAGPDKTIPATLWIKSVRETGQFVNERPRLEFVFRVEPAAGSGVEPYEVTKRATTPFTAMAHLNPGDGFEATVAGPEEPTAMDIAWDRPVRAGGAGPDDLAARLAALDRLRDDAAISPEEYEQQRARILGSL